MRKESNSNIIQKINEIDNILTIQIQNETQNNDSDSLLGKKSKKDIKY